MTAIARTSDFSRRQFVVASLTAAGGFALGIAYDLRHETLRRASAAGRAVDMDWRNVRGRAPGLEGLSGRIALKVGDAPVGALDIDSGGVASVVDDASGAAATITVNGEDTLTGLLRGDLSPIVIELLGRTRIAGDVRFALQVLYGLQAGSPWAATAKSGGG